jgi:hypothetical protein
MRQLYVNRYVIARDRNVVASTFKESPSHQRRDFRAEVRCVCRSRMRRLSTTSRPRGWEHDQ